MELGKGLVVYANSLHKDFVLHNYSKITKHKIKP